MIFPLEIQEFLEKYDCEARAGEKGLVRICAEFSSACLGQRSLELRVWNSETVWSCDQGRFVRR